MAKNEKKIKDDSAFSSYTCKIPKKARCTLVKNV